jgi:glucose-6-phosphate dehydrogenase assembly protein OpcA
VPHDREAKLASVPKHGLAVAFHVLVEPDACPSLGQDHLKRCLAALKRIRPQVVAVQLDQVESLEKHALVSAVVTDEIERGNAVVIASDRLAVDDAGARAQASQRLDDERKAVGEIIARPAVKPDPLVFLAGDDAETVMLDFM